MKFIRQLKEFESKAEYMSDKYFEDYKQYFEDRRRIQYGLSKNQYFAACVDAEINRYIHSSDGAIYITKNLNTTWIAHTPLNCIVEISPDDNVLEIGVSK